MATVIQGHQFPDKRFHFKGPGTGSAADITEVDTWVQQVVFTNPDTGGALTLDVADLGATPWELYNDLSVADNTIYVQRFEPPILMSGGIKVTAPAGMDIQIIGLQKP